MARKIVVKLNSNLKFEIKVKSIVEKPCYMGGVLYINVLYCTKQ